MPNKPIGEVYKVFTLCDYEYTYTLEFYSRIAGAQGIFESDSTSNQLPAAVTSDRLSKLTPTPQTCL